MGKIAEQQPDLVAVFEVSPSIEITSDEVDKLAHNTVFNDVYAEYYNQLADELGEEQYKKNAERMLNCHQRWWGDHYEFQAIFDARQFSLCHDRFCVNCQHLKQAAQMQRFTKILDETVKEHDLYMMTLTVPNCPIGGLKDSLERFALAFHNIMRYFAGNSVIAGIDFASYGFFACYRNIEIVVHPTCFHPHYHCILALKKDIDEKKLTTNDYSYSYGAYKRSFSSLEILIQKVLALKYNNIRLDKIVVDYVLKGIAVDKKKLKVWCEKYKVNMRMLNSFRRQGYSCVIDKIEGGLWHEVFKYVTKLNKDGGAIMSYYQFKALVPVLKHMHIGQGYGAWYKLPKDEWEIDPDVLAAYEFVIRHLREVEDPIPCTFELLQLKDSLHKKSIKCISRKKAYKFVQEWLKDRDLDSDAVSSVTESNPDQFEEKHEQMRFDLDLVSIDDEWDPF